MRDFFSLKLEKETPGKTIKSFRTNFKITLKKLSKVTGMSESSLSAIENGRVEIGFKRVVLIASALGLEPSVILFPLGFSPYQKEIERVKKAAGKL